MSRATTPKAGKPAAETVTTEVATEAVAAAAAEMGDVEDVGERDTVVGAPPVATMNDPVAGEGGPPPDDAPPAAAAAHIPTPLAEPVSPEAVEAGGTAPAAESEPESASPAPVSDETFFRCNGCGKPGPVAETAEASLEKALAEGWYMSEHPTPLPYCCGGATDPSEFPFERRGRPAPAPSAG